MRQWGRWPSCRTHQRLWIRETIQGQEVLEELRKGPALHKSDGKTPDPISLDAASHMFARPWIDPALRTEPGHPSNAELRNERQLRGRGSPMHIRLLVVSSALSDVGAGPYSTIKGNLGQRSAVCFEQTTSGTTHRKRSCTDSDLPLESSFRHTGFQNTEGGGGR